MRSTTPLEDALVGWELLAESSAQLPTQCPMWAQACAATLPDPPRIVVRGGLQTVQAVAPLAWRNGHLELLGTAQVPEPTDLLASSPEALADLVETVIGARRALHLRRLPADSATIAALTRAVGRRGIVLARRTVGFPTVTLSESWQEPGGGLSSRRRSDLRRARRRAEAMGDVEFELLSPASHEVPALLELAYAIEARSWKAREGRALAHVSWLARFFTTYATAAAERGELRVQFLRIGGTAVAMQLGVEWKRSCWLFKIGYDESYSTASPGQLLLAESIADAARSGLRTYELLGQQAIWTDVWTRDVSPCAMVLVYPLGMSSGAALARTGATQVARWAAAVNRRRAATFR